MLFDNPNKNQSVSWLLINFWAAVGSILLLAILYFYVYLPYITHHGEFIRMPDIRTLTVDEATTKLQQYSLQIAINDSSYSENEKPFSILKQFPKEGEEIKSGRIVYVSVNRTTPPTLPMPNLLEGSLTNAEAVLKSSELRRGKIIYQPNPFKNFVITMLHAGKAIEANTRVHKGAIIDLVVGDGNENTEMFVGDLLGSTYQEALLKISSWNLILGEVNIPAGVDTTQTKVYVYKQLPMPGDSVLIGEPINIWIAPKNYQQPIKRY